LNSGYPGDQTGEFSVTVRQLILEQTACPLCGSSSSVYWLSGRDNLCGIPGEFHVVRCRDCQHFYMNPRPVRESLADCYPPDYSPHVPTAQNATDPAPGAAPRPWYLRWLPLRYIPGLKRLYNWLLDDRSQPVPSAAKHRAAVDMPADAPLRALEIGCATGRYLKRLETVGWQVQGVELSSWAAARATAAGLPVHCGMLQTLPDDGCPYDLAAAWHVLEHVPDVRGTLQELLRRLRPGGQLLISIPNAGCWEPRFFGSAWYLWELPRHLHAFTPRSITRLLSECGFVDIRVQHQRTLLNVFGSLGIALLNRRPRSRLGHWLKSYPEQPRLFLQLLLAPTAHLLAFVGQGGRLTIFARKAPGDSQ
jgi:SAM-dependent methyltransferase